MFLRHPAGALAPRRNEQIDEFRTREGTRVELVAMTVGVESDVVSDVDSIEDVGHDEFPFQMVKAKPRQRVTANEARDDERIVLSECMMIS